MKIKSRSQVKGGNICRDDWLEEAEGKKEFQVARSIEKNFAETFPRYYISGIDERLIQKSKVYIKRWSLLDY